MPMTILMALTALIGSASTASPTTPHTQEFTGRLEFWGEFTLYPVSGSLTKKDECVSGAFPLRKHLRAKKLYSGKAVRIKGRKVRYSSLVEQVGATERGWKGTPIPNYCGGEYVILAYEVRKISKPRSPR